MGKSNYFSSKSVFGQLISLIDDKIIKDAVKKNDSDRYVKRFKSKDHLISMLFCSFAKCNSLREVSGAMLGLSGANPYMAVCLKKLLYKPKMCCYSFLNSSVTKITISLIY